MTTQRTKHASTVSQKRGTRRKRPIRRATATVVSMMFFAALLLPAPAEAQGERSAISGDAVPSDCNNGKGLGAIELTGDLEGCLIFFPKTAECTEYNGFALYEEAGVERFIGSYNGEAGKFRTKYTLAGTYAQGACADFEAEDYGTFFSKQLTGGCDHYVKGKTGAFKGMKGLITFHDVIPNPGTSGASNFFYTGYLK